MTTMTTTDPGLRDAAAVLRAHPDRLFRVAHRILNDASDAAQPTT